MKSRKSRFDVVQWCDFFRGVAEPALAEAMEQELGRRPPGPGSAPSLLHQVEITARSDLSLPVPESMVRQAEDIFDLQQPERTPFRFLPFELVADSRTQFALAGARSDRSSHRGLVFESEQYSVNLRAEPSLFPSGEAVTGQLLRRGRQGDAEDRPMAEVPVIVVCRGGEATRTETGPYGEFQATGLQTPVTKVYLLVDRKRCIQLPIPESEEPY